ncbi:MAG: hypothetical protein EPO27_16075 [Betaproteobacteria bacterium]|nr:MAG: hypothetical protein EPO27_16075 [Betaproteobacteria bacterium]
MPIGRTGIAVAATFIFAQSVARACSCTPVTFDQQVARATHIFVAHIASTAEVLDAERGSDPNDPTHYFIEARYRAIDVLKGSPPDEGVVRDWRPFLGSCSARLMAGTEFIIFASAQLGTNMCSGTTWFNPVKGKDELSRIRKVLETVQ